MASNTRPISDETEPTGADDVTEGAVRNALRRVTDPELDRSIVELGYIDAIEVEPRETSPASVDVDFTLPTAWCSPAFAWMMASDAREAIEGLSGVADCTVHLHDHMHADEVNEGVNGNDSFGAAFPDADGGVAAVRSTLDEKARMARQYTACEALLEAGLTGEQIATLTCADVERIADGERVAVRVRESALRIVLEADPLVRYLRKARTVGLFEDCERLFRTPEGTPVDPEGFELLHRRSRLAQVNMDGQGGVCDALHESRREQLADD